MIGGNEGGITAQGIRRVVDFALFGWGKAGAGECVVQGGSQGVYVCPWAHVSTGAALFCGTEARSFHDVFAQVAVGFARGAEVDDDGETCAGDEDVVRLDITVE